ncbi:hypothetical protein NMY22_g8545 [Coprinellus aureogranulatus]|nr:hypothetical protein NMY22_g8545 [Coprinellus aureogranulatus]
MRRHRRSTVNSPEILKGTQDHSPESIPQKGNPVSAETTTPGSKLKLLSRFRNVVQRIGRLGRSMGSRRAERWSAESTGQTNGRSHGAKSVANGERAHTPDYGGTLAVATQEGEAEQTSNGSTVEYQVAPETQIPETRESTSKFNMFANAHSLAMENPKFTAVGRDIINVNIASSSHLSPSSLSLRRSGSVLKIYASTTLGPGPGERSQPKWTGLVRIVRLHPSPNVFEKGVTEPSIDDLEIPAVQIQTLTNPEVYVRKLSPGRGLACWRPEPFHPLVGERGIVPGDVGTYTPEDGFRKSFNIWDDAASIRASALSLNERAYLLPPSQLIYQTAKLDVGDIISEGVSSRPTVCTVGRVKFISSCDFKCPDEQGAVLVLTSPADLEEIRDQAALHDWLLKHIRLICKFANLKCRIGRDDSLYIVTGCIKSDSWALAAYKKSMEPPDHTIRLERDDMDDPHSLYSWTERGQHVEARSSKILPGGLKSQSLFLRGFKLSLSPDFYATLAEIPVLNSRPSSTRSNSHDSRVPDNRDAFGNQQGEGGQGQAGGSGQQFGGHQASGVPTTMARASPDDVKVHMVPEHRADAYHPSETINKFLLESTGADVALTHDDEWIHRMPTDSSWNVSLRDMLLQIKRTRLVNIRDGVAFLAPVRKRASHAGLGGPNFEYFLAGLPSPTTRNLDARFGVEILSFTATPTLHLLHRANGDIFMSDWPHVRNLAGLTSVTYHNAPPSVHDEWMKLPLSCWQSIFDGPPLQAIILACYLWHLIRSVDTELEYVYRGISTSTLQMLDVNPAGYPARGYRAEGEQWDAFSLPASPSPESVSCRLHHIEYLIKRPRPQHRGIFIDRERLALLDEAARLRGAARLLEVFLPTSEARFSDLKSSMQTVLNGEDVDRNGLTQEVYDSPSQVKERKDWRFKTSQVREYVHLEPSSPQMVTTSHLHQHPSLSNSYSESDAGDGGDCGNVGWFRSSPPAHSHGTQPVPIAVEPHRSVTNWNGWGSTTAAPSGRPSTYDLSSLHETAGGTWNQPISPRDTHVSRRTSAWVPIGQFARRSTKGRKKWDLWSEEEATSGGEVVNNLDERHGTHENSCGEDRHSEHEAVGRWTEERKSRHLPSREKATSGRQVKDLSDELFGGGNHRNEDSLSSVSNQMNAWGHVDSARLATSSMDSRNRK